MTPSLEGTCAMPTEITYPGVYLEECSTGVHTIEGVPTSVAAFVGYTPEGPIGEPIEVASFADFQNTFGPSDPSTDVAFAVEHFFANGGTQAWVTRVVGEADPTHPSPAELIGSEDPRTGMQALRDIDLFNIVSIPNQADPSIHTAMIELAQARRAFAILDLPDSIATLSDAQAWIENYSSSENSNAAAYFPRILFTDPAQSGFRSCANSGAIAGIFARTDQQHGVWKAPAGVEARIEGADDLQLALTEGEQDQLNASGLNALCNFIGFGNVVWGSRTLAGADALGSEWKYVPVRRTALFIEESLYRGLTWAVFEPNAEPLWAEVRQSVGNFLHALFKQGAFKGATPRDAYFVHCDATTTTQNDINQGMLNILVGFALLKPAEFIILRIALPVAA